MNTNVRPPLPISFWLACISTGLIAAGAGMGWVQSDGGYEIGGQTLLVESQAPVDPSLVYLAAGISAFGLLLYAFSRSRVALLLPALAALGAGAVLGVDVAELLDGSGLKPGTGAYLVAGSALVTLVCTFLMPGGGRKVEVVDPPLPDRTGDSSRQGSTPVPQPPKLEAGWYEDPGDPGRFYRYWDGEGWTEHTSGRRVS